MSLGPAPSPGSSPRPTRFVLLRHAESGTPGVYYGRSDVAVTPAGREAEAAALARLRGYALSTVVTSPLSRCAHLAGRIAEQAGVELHVEPELAEIHLGDWEGRTFDEAASVYQEIGRQLLSKSPELAFPGGESLAGFRERVAGAWEKVTDAHARAGAAVLVACHAGVIRALLGHLRQTSAADFWTDHIPNLSVTVVDTDGADPRLPLIGGTVDDLLDL
jgi:broad specificity phosphatase PhoE